MQLGLLNLLVIAAYFVGMVLIGMYFSRGQNSQDSYFLGNRGFGGWVLGISMIGALISSITFIAGPADTFKTAWLRVIPQLAIPVGALIVAYYVMPFFRKRGIVSAYGYLNERFGRPMSVYAAFVFLAGQIVRTSTILYLLAILLQSISGIGFVWCLLVMGIVTAIYTAKGGYSAVIWTDLIQCFVLASGAVIAVGMIIWMLPGGLGEIFAVARENHKLTLWDINGPGTPLAPVTWSFSLSEKSITALLLSGFLGFILSTLDQGNVQRWSSAKSDAEARRSILVLGTLALPIWFGFKFVGTSLYAYYTRFPDAVSKSVLDGIAKAEEIFPHFIMTSLPAGIAGLVISGALAAAMSTQSACINASAMVWVRDLYSPLISRGRDDKHYLRVGKLTAWVISAIMIVGAYLIGLASTATLADLILMIGGILIGTVPGVFILGMMTKRANLPGVCVGLLAACTFLAWCSVGSMGLIPENIRLPFHMYYSGPLGNIITIFVGYIFSLILPAKPAVSAISSASPVVATLPPAQQAETA